MKKITLVLFATLLLSACGERESVTKLRNFCADDVAKNQLAFNCDCQIDIFKDSLSDSQMDLLAKFVETEKVNRDESLKISKQAGFEDLFKILVKKAPEIEQNCRK